MDLNIKYMGDESADDDDGGVLFGVNEYTRND